MELVTRRQRVAEYVPNLTEWLRVRATTDYYREQLPGFSSKCAAKLGKLQALGPHPTPDEYLAEFPEDRAKVYINCDECGKEYEQAVKLSDGTVELLVCGNCLFKAFQLHEEER